MGAISKFQIDENVDSIKIVDGGGSITIDASDLDIRDLSSATDSISAVQSGTWNVNISDNGGSITVDASDLDIRDLSHTSDSIKIGDGTDFLAVNADGSINVIGSLSVNDTQNTANLAQNVPVTDAAAVALPTTPLANRERLIIQNLGSNAVYLGAAGVASTTGLLLPKGDSIEVWAGPSNAVYAICATGKTADLRIWELS